MNAPVPAASLAIEWLSAHNVQPGDTIGLAIGSAGEGTAAGFGLALAARSASDNTSHPTLDGTPDPTTGEQPRTDSQRRPGSETRPASETQPDKTMIERRGFSDADPCAAVAAIEAALGPRWVWWDHSTPNALATHDVAVQRCWDITSTHQLIHGGAAPTIDELWSQRRGLDPTLAPLLGQLDLLTVASLTSAIDSGTDDPAADTEERAHLSNGYLKPGWVASGYARSPETLAHWAELAMVEFGDQLQEIADVTPPRQPARLLSTVRVESAAAMLSAELGARGLPFRVDVAERIIGDAAGPRPRDVRHEERLRAERDQQVLDLAPPGRRWDLRSPADVKQLLRSIELDLPDTRAWRLKEHIDHHPLVPELLNWRKAERLSNTYGYRWLDSHVSDDRLRGTWSPSDGAAGRMTASSGLHNLPAELRPAVVADPAHVFVRADLGQIEPRVLAAMSGDEALIAATAEDDLYTTIGRRLRVERDVAKLALLGAMYGSTTGEAANALRRLVEAYPAALNLLEQAAQRGRGGETVYTSGGRPVHMWTDDTDGDIERARRVAAARGRFARNAVVQGSAAEFFKMWAVTVRVRARPIDGDVVLCLHDELLLHVPEAHAAEGMRVVLDALNEVATRWSPTPGVRFVADASIVTCWADAK